MITVGVKELKNRLSQYLQYVKNGEKVVITEHNKIIAEISLPEKTKEESKMEEKLKQLAEDGKLVLSKRNKSYAKMPDDNNKLDWRAVYEEIRRERK